MIFLKEKKIVIINNKKFLIVSALKMRKDYNLLGFWEDNSGWEKHISSYSMPHVEFEKLFKSPITT